MHRHDPRNGSAPVGHFNHLPGGDSSQYRCRILTELPDPTPFHVIHCSTSRRACISRAPSRGPPRRVAESAASRVSKAPSAETIATVRGLINGHWVTQSIHVLLRLGIPDQLAAGPRSETELAAGAGVHEQSLYRLLRAVAAIGLLNELPDRRFALTELGEALRSDVPGSLAGWAAFVGRGYEFQAWTRLYDNVMTG